MVSQKMRPGARAKPPQSSGTDAAVGSSRGGRRWEHGHPWIFRSDIVSAPGVGAGIAQVAEVSGRPLGVALWSPPSEISLRLLDRDPVATIDAAWWRTRIAAAAERRAALDGKTSAYRLIHEEADGLPSLICDRYDRWLVVQLMSAGLERFRDAIIAALLDHVRPDGILARNDVALRAKEGLPSETTLLAGEVPHEIEVHEGQVRYLAAPWTGQKTGAFLDQRENRVFVGTIARGRALDCFSYHGSFALHLARGADHVTAIDSSANALER